MKNINSPSLVHKATNLLEKNTADMTSVSQLAAMALFTISHYAVLFYLQY